MHIHTFDRYLHQESLVHRLDPRVKVLITAFFILSNVILPDGAWLAFLAAWGLILAFSLAARLSPWLIFKRALVVTPFLLAAVTIIFTLPGKPVATWQLGGWRITASDAGLIRFATIFLRSWLSVQMAILLTSTTQFPDLMHALHHLRVPRILVSIISFMYRYLFVLADEAMRLMRAREARSASLGNGRSGGSLWWRARVTGSMAGQLLLRSLARSERVYEAMVARGYRGHLLTMNPHVMERHDWLADGLALILIGLVQLLGLHYGV